MLDKLFIAKIKRSSSINTGDRVMILAFCTSSIGPPSMFQVSFNSLVHLSAEHLTRKSGVLGSIPSLATYLRFSFRFFKKGSCQLLAKVCARNTG